MPFRLARRETPTATDAYLLPADSTPPLADSCVRLGGDTPPDVFPVRGGFVLVPRSAGSRHIPGTIRLRRVGGDLFVPADADLLPALLPDEVAALTRDRGLVVLPGGEVLAFDAVNPLPVCRWVAPARVRREAWQPFPPRPERSDTLTVVERPVSPAAVLEVLRAGAPDDAEPLPGAGAGGAVPEEARPSTGSALGRAAAGVGLAAGGLLAWLGKQLGAPGLARLGGNLARNALESIPRLSEKLFGRQEAALREVLRQLQSGDVEKGLTRAPIAVPDPEQPSRVGSDAQLGRRDPRYSLRDLIGSGGGPATAWLGGGDVWAELAREYRRLAEEAAARGDFRRAAYLHGVLLRDLRSAANTLMRGGLCRDAAVLFRDRLNDPTAAAQAFERAGDHDEALRLYEKHGHYEKAAELLRRLGEEDRAVAYFIRAADELAGRGLLLGAGDLVRTKAGRHDLATAYYRRGWDGDTAEGVACGERLLDEYLVAEDLAAVGSLLAEAEAVFASRPGDAGRFFNYALRAGDPFLPPETRDALGDRVRMLFASHLRAAGSAASGERLAAELFGGRQPWPGPVVRDATFAVRKMDHRDCAQDRPPHAPPVKLAPGTVTAVAVARGTFDVVVATTEAVVYWQVGEGRVVPVCRPRLGAVTTLSVDPRGEVVYALHTDRNEYLLSCHAADRSGSFTPMGEAGGRTEGEAGAECYLPPPASFREGELRVILAVSDKRSAFAGHFLFPASPYPWPANGLATRLLLDCGGGDGWEWADGCVRCWSVSRGDTPPLLGRWPEPWSPARSRAGPEVDWLTPGPGVLELAGIDWDGRVRWAEFDAHDPGSPRSRFASSSSPSSYVATCLTGEGALVAVTNGNVVHRLRMTGSMLETTGSARLDVPSAVVTLVARPEQSEVVAILADGFAVHLSIQ